MSEWWTYSLTSFLLFSSQTYYRLFELTNAAVWPLQIVTLGLGLATVLLIIRAPAWSGRAVAVILAALWLFVAWAYHWERFDPINFAARYYALGFAMQTALLIWTGAVRDRLNFAKVEQQTPLIPAQAGIQSPNRSASNSENWTPAGVYPRPRSGTGVSGVGCLALALLIYALALHPLIPLLAGRPWTQAEIFGLAPDPTAIATLGILLATTRPHWHLLALPLLSGAS
jgi:hypothetical protein